MSCVRSPWRWDLSELKLLRSYNLLCNFSILREKKCLDKEMVKSGYTLNHRSIRSVHVTLLLKCSVLIIDVGAVMGCLVCVCPTLSGGGHRGGEGG